MAKRLSSSVDILALKLSLHKKLLSIIPGPQPERHVIECVVTTVWEHFPDHRVAYSVVNAEGEMHVLYSREPASQPSLTGVKGSLLPAPDFLRELRERRPVVVEDMNVDSRLSPLAEQIRKVAGSVARLDCPMGRDPDEVVHVLSFTHSQPQKWEPFKVEMVREVADLIHLMLREARAREELKRSEMIFRQFAEHIQSVFWMANPDNSEMIYVSPAYDQVWGVPRQHLFSNAMAFLDSVVEEDRPAVRESMKEHYKGPFEKVYRVRRPSGEIRWVKDRSFPIRNEQGQIYRVVGIADDITDLHEAQARLEATQAQVISKAKFAALGEMASGIAHEINNPLAVIQGIAEQMQEVCGRPGSEDPMLRDSFVTVAKMSKRIAAIVKGLRTFSRHTDWDPMVPTDLSAVLHDAIAMCEARMQSSGVTIDTQSSSERLIVRCRSSEICQVLVNLLNNAMDAVAEAPHRHVLLEARHAGDKIFFSVADSGPGVELDLRDRIFQPFFTTKEVGKGTGLGLSISKSIVEAHGGRLYIDPLSSRTRFVLELPAEKQ